jgi:hypothetical protein
MAKPPKFTTAELNAQHAREVDDARADPPRVARYLRWWLDRPSRWVVNLRDDDSEDDLEDAPEAEYFAGDAGAHEVSRELGLLVTDPRPGHSGWEISDAGLAFAREHASLRPGKQLGLFGEAPA